MRIRRVASEVQVLVERVMYVSYKHDTLFVSLKVCIWLLSLVTKFWVSFTLLLGTSIHLLVAFTRDEQLLHV